MPLTPQLLEMLVCPVCKGDLQYETNPETLSCPRCRLRYKVQNDIPNMIVEEAEKF